MSALILDIYHKFPYPLKVIAASLEGYRLRWQRYGPETERLVAEAREREQWSLERWQAWQGERLAYILHRAATMVPYYKEQWTQRRRRGDRSSWEYLENWPILEKEPLRANPRAFLAEDCDPRRMICLHTSGTTGTPLTLWRSYATERAYYAIFEARNRRWYGVSRQDRWGILGGKLVTPINRRRPPFWVWNAGLNQLYMSSYHLASDLIPYYLDALEKYRIVYLWGYTSSLMALAHEVLRQKRDNIKLKLIITNAEPLYVFQREVLTEAFRCPVRENYGMTEIVLGASECEAGFLHLWPEVGLVEIITGDKPAGPGEIGDFVCTGLINPDMPLIRYRLGDRGALPRESKSCSCGRNLPILQQVEGRADDVLLTMDGRQVGRLDPVFKADYPIKEAQIIQESLQQIRVRLVPAVGYNDKYAREIKRQLQERLGPMQIDFELIDSIPRDVNGKFRAVVSKIKN